MKPVLRVLYGPPGTGKTWRAARDAVRLIEDANDDEIVARHRALVESGRIIWVTFHPSYSYEDFVEGFRPTESEGGILYRPENGPFRIACERCLGTPPLSALFSEGETLTSSSNNSYEVLQVDGGVLILRNVSKTKDGTEKSGYGLETPQALWLVKRVRERLGSIGFGPKDLSLSGKKKEEKVKDGSNEFAKTFAVEDERWGDFFSRLTGVDKQSLFSMTGPLRAVWEAVEKKLNGEAWDSPEPEVNADGEEQPRETGKAEEALDADGDLAGAVESVGGEEDTGEDDTEDLPGPAIEATALPAEWPVVLVIDEINRADLSRVFGELITLLEPDKRLGAAEERKVVLPYSKEVFGVPSSLHIVATMNTADRSLTLMDHALRRRFEFVEVPPDPEMCAKPYAGVDLPELLTSWNTRITALLSRDHRLGHSYLMPRNLKRLEAEFLEDEHADVEERQLRALALALRRNIVPLLVEYFHDDWRKANIVLGRNYNTNKGGLLTSLEFKQVAEAAGELFDLDDATDFELPDFWEPMSDKWDAAKFRSLLV